uniref:Uncharacterized protein n=1 Tax=Romanomermis culicivorax TaxID=13658 RepID=A0A915L0H7_ROMCU
MSIVSKISRTSLKSLDDSIKLCLIADKALDMEVVSDVDRINTKILPKILFSNVANDRNVQQCLDPSTKIAPSPLFGHLLCSKLKERGPKDETLAVA